MTYISGYEGTFNPAVAAVIANTEQESSAINLAGRNFCGIYLPAAFTGTALTFLASDAIDGDYLPIKVTTSGTALSYTVAQGNYVAVNPQDFLGVNFLKVVSGSAQAAERTIKCAVKG